MLHALLDRLVNFLLIRTFATTGRVRAAIQGLRFAKFGSCCSLGRRVRILGGRFCEFGDFVSVASNTRIECFSAHNLDTFKPTFRVGSGTSINFDCHIACINSIVIGRDVLIASRVFISDHSHGDPSNQEHSAMPPSCRPLHSKSGIEIGDCAWIGEGVSILPGSKIGDNCIIGANSVVSGVIPSNSIAVGAPARVIRKLNEKRQ